MLLRDRAAVCHWHVSRIALADWSDPKLISASSARVFRRSGAKAGTDSSRSSPVSECRAWLWILAFGTLHLPRHNQSAWSSPHWPGLQSSGGCSAKLSHEFFFPHGISRRGHNPGNGDVTRDLEHAYIIAVLPGLLSACHGHPHQLAYYSFHNLPKS